MNPITSRYDVRLIILVGLAIDLIESLALEVDSCPQTILAEYLYLTTKRVHEVGEETYMTKLTTHYPMLEEAIN